MSKEQIARRVGRNAVNGTSGTIIPRYGKFEGARGRNSRGQKPSRGRNRGRIKKTTEDAESTKSDDEVFGQAAEHLAQAKKVKDGNDYRTVTVMEK